MLKDFGPGEGEVIADPPVAVGSRRQRLAGLRMQVVAQALERWPCHRAGQTQPGGQLAAPLADRLLPLGSNSPRCRSIS